MPNQLPKNGRRFSVSPATDLAAVLVASSLPRESLQKCDAYRAGPVRQLTAVYITEACDGRHRSVHVEVSKSCAVTCRTVDQTLLKSRRTSPPGRSPRRVTQLALF